jgi:hypothetical protein
MRLDVAALNGTFFLGTLAGTADTTMNRTRFLSALAACVASLLAATQAIASIQSIGVDIGSNGSQTIVPFFDQSPTGYELRGEAFFGWIQGDAITIVLDTASIFGAGSLTAAELFIDAFNVDSWNTSEVYIQGSLVGSLLNTPSSSPIPVAAGPLGAHVVNSNFDVDNTFFDLAPFLADLATDSTFTIQIRNTTDPFLFVFPGEKIRIDGINIQAVTVDALPDGEPGVVPEPAAIAVWSILAASAIGICYRPRLLG